MERYNSAGDVSHAGRHTDAWTLRDARVFKDNRHALSQAPTLVNEGKPLLGRLGNAADALAVFGIADHRAIGEQ